jgi:hypothetical protein
MQITRFGAAQAVTMGIRFADHIGSRAFRLAVRRHDP